MDLWKELVINKMNFMNKIYMNKTTNKNMNKDTNKSTNKDTSKSMD